MFVEFMNKAGMCMQACVCSSSKERETEIEIERETSLQFIKKTTPKKKSNADHIVELRECGVETKSVEVQSFAASDDEASWITRGVRKRPCCNTIGQRRAIAM